MHVMPRAPTHLETRLGMGLRRGSSCFAIIIKVANYSQAAPRALRLAPFPIKEHLAIRWSPFVPSLRPNLGAACLVTLDAACHGCVAAPSDRQGPVGPES